MAGESKGQLNRIKKKKKNLLAGKAVLYMYFELRMLRFGWRLALKAFQGYGCVGWKLSAVYSGAKPACRKCTQWSWWIKDGACLIFQYILKSEKPFIWGCRFQTCKRFASNTGCSLWSVNIRPKMLYVSSRDRTQEDSRPMGPIRRLLLWDVVWQHKPF